jgi:hypothetical protein
MKKKRNRLNCKWFYNCAKWFKWIGGTCNTDKVTGEGKSGKCIGVNCGHYKEYEDYDYVRYGEDDGRSGSVGGTESYTPGSF